MENDEIDLKQLFELIWDKRIFILVVILISVVIGYIYTNFFVEPKYTASTTLILAQSNSTTDSTSSGTITQTDVNLNDKLIDTYTEIAKSNSVIRAVIKDLGLTNISEGELKKEISVTSVTGTQVLKISATDKDAELATKIANEMREVFSDRIKDIYKIENVSLLDEAEVPSMPSNVNHKRDMLIFFAIGIVLSIVIVLLMNMLDNSIKSSADIENALRLNILAEIPECDFGRRR